MESNINKFIAYFQNGEKKVCEKIGVELEHFVIKNQKEAASYEDVLEVIEKVKGEGFQVFVEGGHVLGLYNEDYSITLEPAAQMEISIAPKKTIREMEQVYETFRATVDEPLQEKSLHFEMTGYHPYKKVSELSLIPKKRYDYMNRYFESSGTLGKNMMRATASTQIAIDYENESDFVEKYRLAYILSPVFALITDNSPVFEGKQADRHLVRTHIWMHTDDARCGIATGCFADDFGYKKYAEYICNVPPILIKDAAGNASSTGTKTLREVFAGHAMTLDEIEYALSMVFPDVRLKNYIEIRMADSMELSYALAYCALVKTLFYSEQARKELVSYFGTITEDDVTEAKKSFIREGYEGYAYGKSAAQIVDKLVALARQYGQEEEKQYMACLLEKMQSRTAIYETRQ